MAEAKSAGGGSVPGLAVAALGVVFGDLGTSPLYTFQTIVEAIAGRFTPDAALGVLSLIFWTLIITVSVKYALFVMRADNDGEGGILALMAKVGANALKGRKGLLAVMGLVGAALIYGDGAITPAISVLSALEGVNVATPVLKPYVLPGAVVILIALFSVQGFGTSKIGALFGPIMLLWFLVIAVLGVVAVLPHPEVLKAISPVYAAKILASSGLKALAILGGVFLCITGAEALYADMGHFGRGPIRLSWFAVVLPALLLSYAGQTATVLTRNVGSDNPFYLQAPGWAVIPLVVLSTLATIIASQAIITGAFSMTRQAVQLGWLPSMTIRQTSATAYGQIYVPVVNGLMAVATIAIAVGFGSSARLAGAYGTAVSTTMLLTTGLLATAMITVWRWPLRYALPSAGLFLIVDLAFFSANLLKLFEGGWVPLTLGALIFGIMVVWRWGVDRIRGDLIKRSEPADKFLNDLTVGKVARVPGTAVFLSRTEDLIPPSILQHVRFMHGLYERVLILNVYFEDTPRAAQNRSTLQALGQGLWRVKLSYGFTEIPDIPDFLKGLKEEGLDLDLTDVTYISSRDMVITARNKNPLHRGAAALFGFLYRNAARVVDRFRLPPDEVVEVAREIQI